MNFRMLIRDRNNDDCGTVQQETAPPVTELSPAECWQYLGEARFGRLGVYGEGEIDIIPINIVARNNKVYFRSGAGSKLKKLLEHDRVTVEIDSVQGGMAYSVVARGQARILSGEDEIAMVNQLPLVPWIPTVKREYVEVSPTKVTGRHFQLGHEPDDPAIEAYRNRG